MGSLILFKPPRQRKPSPVSEKDKELAKRKITYMMKNLEAQMERLIEAQTESIRIDAHQEIQSIEQKVIQEMTRYGLVAEDFR